MPNESDDQKIIDDNKSANQADDIKIDDDKTDDIKVDIIKKDDADIKPDNTKETPVFEPIAADSHEHQQTTRNNSISDIFGHNNDDAFYPKQVKTIGESHIEVQQYDIPSSKTNDNSDQDPADQVLVSNKNNAGVPIANQINSSRTLGIATTLSIIVLVLGFGGGYFSYKYWPNLTNRVSISADTNTPTTPPETLVTTSISPTIAPTIIVSPTPEDPLKNWSNYTNTKFAYSVKYPDTWFGDNINNDQAAAIQLTSFKPSSTGSEIQTGSKVEIVFQNSNSKLLKDWIKDNNIVSGFGTPELTPLKIDGKDAYQQTVVSNGQSTSTYVFQSDKIMVITYYAPVNTFAAGKTVYTQIINSIKLQ